MAGNRKKERLNLEKSPIEDFCSNLPSDVLESVLSRLPVKALLRFKSVCRCWYSVISGQKFARIHLQQSKKSASKHHFLWRPSHVGGLHLVRYEDGKFLTEAALEFPEQKCNKYFTTFSGDGLVLLAHRSHSFILCNPSSRIYMEFTNPFPCDTDYKYFGLCQDLPNNSYRVVMVCPDGMWYVFYSLANDYWTEKQEFTYHLNANNAVFHNGTPHYISQILDEGYGDGVPSGVVYLDTSDDKFKEFPLPDTVMNFTAIRVELIVLKKHLCFCRTSDCNTRLDIWMMREYDSVMKSWMKLHTIENVPVVPTFDGYFTTVTVLYITTKDEVVLDIFRYGYIVYDPKSKKFGRFQEFFDTNSASGWNENLCPVQCSDSLIFPIKGRRLREIQLAERENSKEEAVAE